MIKFAVFLTIVTVLSAKYTNCNFKNDNYEQICKSAVKRGVSIEYANSFLLSKANKLDMKSFKLFQPKQIKTHHANEKRANNSLVKYVPQIVEHIKKYRYVYDRAEKKYGVNREIIAAILMKETRLGKIKPKHDAYSVFNTLVLKTETNSARNRWLVKLAKSNMLSIISYCYDKNLKPLTCNFASSYAGAVGIPQFMPNNFTFIESYKNKTGNLNNMQDAIMSASKFLNKVANFNKLIEWKKIPDMKRVEEQWYEYDFKHKNSSFVYAKSEKTGKKYSCFACKNPKLEYLRGYARKIMTYNNSSNYAIGVFRLAYDAYQQERADEIPSGD